MALIDASSAFIATAVKDTVRVFFKSSEIFMIYKHAFNKEATKDELIDYILLSPFSNYFLVLFSDKTLVVWQMMKLQNSWNKILNISINRRSTSAAFSSDEGEIYVADKSGDLYKIDLAGIASNLEEKKELSLILGHVSILLDVAVTEKFIITADRDEKIRVSSKEKPFVIHSFCLGHTEYVCKVIPIEKHCLISSSGDGTVCMWNLDKGLLLCKSVVSDNALSESKAKNDKASQKQSSPAILSYCSNLNLLAVGNVGVNDNKVAVYRASEPLSSISKCYEIILAQDQHLVDMTFDHSKSELSILYVLIHCNEKIAVGAFSCDITSYCTTQCHLVEFINSILFTESVSDACSAHYLQLYKTTVPGHTYDTFYKKKNDNFKKSRKSKKAKLNTENQFSCI